MRIADEIVIDLMLEACGQTYSNEDKIVE